MNLETSIEAVLFYKSEPIKKTELADFFDVSLDDVEHALESLAESLQDHAMSIISTDTDVELVTRSEVSEIIDLVRKNDLKSDIGKAGAETLSIILYRGPLSRIEIDRIRGVNSTFILRNLLIRGLIERRPHPIDSRSFIYAVTLSLLQHLGIERREDLPEFEEVMNALDSFEREQVSSVSDTDITTEQINLHE